MPVLKKQSKTPTRKCDEAKRKSAKGGQPPRYRNVNVLLKDEVLDEIREDPKEWAKFKKRMRLMTVAVSTEVKNRKYDGKQCKDFTLDILVNGWSEMRHSWDSVQHFYPITSPSNPAKFDRWAHIREDITAITEALHIYSFIFNHSSVAGADNKFFDRTDPYDIEFLRDLRKLVGAYANLRDTREKAEKYYFAYLQNEVRGIAEALDRRRQKYIEEGLADGTADAMLGKTPYVTLADKENLPKPPPKGKKGAKTARKVFDRSLKQSRKNGIAALKGGKR